MADENNVIQLDIRRKREKGSSAGKHPEKASVVDMTERRQEIIQSERRQVKRTILTEFVGACIVVPNRGLMKVTLYDISDNGIAFDLDLEDGTFVAGEEIAVRVYLNHKTYFPFIVKVQNARILEEESLVRFGANFVIGTVNDKALHHFVKFIENEKISPE